jgi:hypothetical protein
MHQEEKTNMATAQYCANNYYYYYYYYYAYAHPRPDLALWASKGSQSAGLRRPMRYTTT